MPTHVGGRACVHIYVVFRPLRPCATNCKQVHACANRCNTPRSRNYNARLNRPQPEASPYASRIKRNQAHRWYFLSGYKTTRSTLPHQGSLSTLIYLCTFDVWPKSSMCIHSVSSVSPEFHIQSIYLFLRGLFEPTRNKNVYYSSPRRNMSDP